jgi:nitroreductase/NAD-dependent dihydropyrimidine dehydrogenase PreA subunit
MTNIFINQDLCIKCNTCATVCVTGIIEKATVSGFPEVLESNVGNCIKCGHCEAFCAQKALTLNFLPGEKIIFAAQDGQIESRDLAIYMKKRRSIRHFSSKPVNKELIAGILDVARYAASGGNGQPVKWLVIYDTDSVKKIAGLTIEWMRSIQHTAHPLAAYVPVILSQWDRRAEPICRNAPHLLFAHIPYNEKWYDPSEAVIAMTHVDIAAPSFGIGTCWAGFVQLAIAGYQPLRDFLDLPQGRVVACSMMFGYPVYKVTSIPRRNPVEVIWK